MNLKEINRIRKTLTKYQKNSTNTDEWVIHSTI